MHKVTVVADVPTWAWASRAKDLKEFAPPQFDVEIAYQIRMDHKALRKSGRSVLYFSWFECPLDIAKYATTMLANPGIQHDRWPNRNPDTNPWISVNATASRNRKNGHARLPKFKRVICLTPELQRIAAEMGARAVCIPTGINHRVFVAKSPLDTTPKLRVGWCGQVSQTDPYNQKGFKWIAEPLMEACKDFCDFKVNTNDYTTALSRQEMVDWYNDIDVFCCTSISEGTPTTAMEAMMCGRPVVTTAVGDMPQIIINGHNGYMVPAYYDASYVVDTVASLKNRLERLHQDRASLVQQGIQARQRMLAIRNWDVLAATWLNAAVNR